MSDAFWNNSLASGVAKNLIHAGSSSYITGGNFGIGINNPATKLHVYSSGGGLELSPGSTTILEFIDRNNTATTVNTLFGSNTQLAATLTVVGLDSGARLTIPITITKTN